MSIAVLTKATYAALMSLLLSGLIRGIEPLRFIKDWSTLEALTAHLVHLLMYVRVTPFAVSLAMVRATYHAFRRGR
jgi:hypothetical protein